MHRLFGWAIALTLAFSPSLALAAREPLKLVPVSKWHVDYAEERCRLAREFGDGTTKATVFFDKHGPGESFRMAVQLAKAGKLSIGRRLKVLCAEDRGTGRACTPCGGSIGRKSSDYPHRRRRTFRSW
jgi:hypothetical protein